MAERTNCMLSLSLKNFKVSRLVPCIHIFFFVTPSVGSCAIDSKARNCKETISMQRGPDMATYLLWRGLLNLVVACRSLGHLYSEAGSGLIKNHMCRSQYWLIVGGRVCFQLTEALPTPSSLINSWQMNEWNYLLIAHAPCWSPVS